MRRHLYLLGRGKPLTPSELFGRFVLPRSDGEAEAPTLSEMSTRNFDMKIIKSQEENKSPGCEFLVTGGIGYGAGVTEHHT